MRIRKLREEFGTIMRESEKLREMEEKLGTTVMDRKLEEELRTGTAEQEREGEFTLVWCKTRRIGKLEKELGSVLVDHKCRKSIQ